MMAASFSASPELRIGFGEFLFDDVYLRDDFGNSVYGLGADGRFLMGRWVDRPMTSTLQIVQGFREEVHRLVSAQQ